VFLAIVLVFVGVAVGLRAVGTVAAALKITSSRNFELPSLRVILAHPWFPVVLMAVPALVLLVLALGGALLSREPLRDRLSLRRSQLRLGDMVVASVGLLLLSSAFGSLLRGIRVRPTGTLEYVDLLIR
jgi:hypothetical protein